MLNFAEPVEIVPLMPVNVGNQGDTLKVTIILFTFQFPTSPMRH